PHVEPERAETLDGVYAEDNAALATERAERSEVAAEAGKELHPAHAEHARPRRERPLYVLDRERSALVRDEVHLNAALAQPEPRVDVSRKLACRHRHAVARPPVEPLREHVQRVRRVRRELDALRARADEPAEPLARPLDRRRDVEVVVRL